MRQGDVLKDEEGGKADAVRIKQKLTIRRRSTGRRRSYAPASRTLEGPEKEDLRGTSAWGRIREETEEVRLKEVRCVHKEIE